MLKQEMLCFHQRRFAIFRHLISHDHSLFLQPDADDLRNAIFFLRDAVERVGGGHGAFVVRDDDELRVRCKPLDD